MRRSAVVVLGAALLGALAPAVPAAAAPAVAAAPGTTGFTVDRMAIGSVAGADWYTLVTPDQAAYPAATAEAATPANGVRLVSGDAAVTLAPPAGQQFAAGTTFPVGPAQSTTSGKYEPLGLCGGGSSWGTGEASVAEATYADGALVSLAADVHWRCGDYPGLANVVSAVRVASDVPYRLVRAAVVGAPPVVGVHTTTPMAVRVDNDGQTTVALGAPALRQTLAGTYAVTADGCGGKVLAPGEGCDVGLAFHPTSYGANAGWQGGLLDVPVAGHPRATGVSVRLGGRVVPPATAPQSAQAFQAPDGVGVAILGQSYAHGGTTAYEVARRPDAESPWTALGTVAPGTAAYVDPTLAPGATAQYAVRGIGPVGDSAYTAAVTTTRPATAPATGENDALVIDTEHTHPPATVLDAADGVTFTPSPQRLQVSAPGNPNVAAVSARLVDGPGVHPTTFLDGVSVGGAGCTPVGDLTVTTAVFDAALKPVAYAADFAGTCDTRPFFYSVRYRAAEPYRAVTAAQPAGAWAVRIGTSGDRDVTLTSAGTAPVTFGVAALGGAYAAEYAVVADGCAGQVVAPGGSCAVTVRATPAARGARPATLSLAADTPRGAAVVPLAMTGATAPGQPEPVQVYRVVGRARIWWGSALDDGGTPLVAHRVYRSVPGGGWTLLAEVPAVPDSYQSAEDLAAEPGVPYSYAVAAVNGVAEGAKRAAAAARSPRAEVLFTHGAADAPWGIYAQNERPESSEGGFDARFASLVDGTDHYTPAVSPDGRRLVYSAPSQNGYGLWVRGFGPGDQPALLTNLSGHEVQPAWSPDGRTIAFTRTASGTQPSVWVVPAAGGAAAKRGGSVSDPSWLPDSDTLVVVDNVSLRLLRLARSGTRTVIPGTVNGRDPAVSPDGRWLAFSRWSTRKHWELTVAPVAGSASPAYTQSNVDRLEPAWRSDGARIVYTSEDDTGNRFVGSVGWSGTFGAWQGVSDRGQESGPAYRALGVHLTSAPHVTGRTASIGFAVTVPLPGETVTCSLDGAAPTACASPWRGTGLAGGTHTLVVRTKASGLPGTVTAHTWTVDATPPVVTMTGPPPMSSRYAVVTAVYHAPGAASYDVRYRAAAPGAWYGGWVYPAAWQKTTATAASLPVKPGTEVCMAVRARDRWGNLSAWHAERCSATAFDDRQLGASPSWARATADFAYFTTLTNGSARGASLTRANVTAARVFLVVERCPACGTVDVFVGSTLFGRVSTRGTAANQVRLALPARAPVTGTLRVVVVSSGAPVRVDGVAVLRR